MSSQFTTAADVPAELWQLVCANIMQRGTAAMLNAYKLTCKRFYTSFKALESGVGKALACANGKGQQEPTAAVKKLVELWQDSTSLGRTVNFNLGLIHTKLYVFVDRGAKPQVRLFDAWSYDQRFTKPELVKADVEYRFYQTDTKCERMDLYALPISGHTISSRIPEVDVTQEKENGQEAAVGERGCYFKPYAGADFYHFRDDDCRPEYPYGWKLPFCLEGIADPTSIFHGSSARQLWFAASGCIRLSISKGRPSCRAR